MRRAAVASVIPLVLSAGPAYADEIAVRSTVLADGAPGVQAAVAWCRATVYASPGSYVMSTTVTCSIDEVVSQRTAPGSEADAVVASVVTASFSVCRSAYAMLQRSDGMVLVLAAPRECAVHTV